MTEGVTILPGGEPRAPTWPDQDIAPFASDNERVVAASIAHSSGSIGVDSDRILTCADGFVHACIKAWIGHQHLVIRPDEVWFMILSQLNLYRSKHHRGCRHLFLRHSGQDRIEVEGGSWSDVLESFGQSVHESIRADWLRDWVTPKFSTSQPCDAVTAAVLMMGVVKARFDFSAKMNCGLPSATLLGTKADWEELSLRAERLSSLGKEPAQYALRLRPILSRFVSSFEAPDGDETRKFWQKIVLAQFNGLLDHERDVEYEVSGWATGFYFWDAQGNPYARPHPLGGSFGIELDSISYPWIDVATLPAVHAETPVTVTKENESTDVQVIAGPIGIGVKAGAPDGYSDALTRAFDNGCPVGGGVDRHGEVKGRPALRHGTIQPLSGWAVNVNVVTGTSKGDDATQSNLLRDAGVSTLLSALRSHEKQSVAHNPGDLDPDTRLNRIGSRWGEIPSDDDEDL